MQYLHACFKNLALDFWHFDGGVVGVCCEGRCFCLLLSFCLPYSHGDFESVDSIIIYFCSKK